MIKDNENVYANDAILNILNRPIKNIDWCTINKKLHLYLILSIYIYIYIEREREREREREGFNFTPLLRRPTNLSYVRNITIFII